MPRIQRPGSMSDANPTMSNKIYKNHNDGEFHKMMENDYTDAAVTDPNKKVEYITITAPSNLPSGYELNVETLDGNFWTVQVPHGGVTMNETFRAKVLHKLPVIKATTAAAVGTTSASGHPVVLSSSNKTDPLMTSTQFNIPNGRWRDGIFDCCIMPLHPILIATYCFPLITLGQVMTRVRFNLCGSGNGNCCDVDRRNRHIYPRAFYIMLGITIFKFFFFSNFGRMTSLIYNMDSGMGLGTDYNTASYYNPYSYSSSSYGWSDDEWNDFFNATGFEDDFYTSWGDYSSYSSQPSGASVNVSVSMGPFRLLASLIISIFILVVHTKTRNRIRRAYSIGNDMFCLGDCCCAWWCSACSICQMARHTANYHTTHRARCCTPNGLDEEWDEYDFLPSKDHPPSRSYLPTIV